MKKYASLVQEMFAAHEDLFTRFRVVHDNYATNPEKYKAEFNTLGSEVVDVIRRYERLLCGKMGNSQYSQFSGGLSDKFWSAIRLVFPKIDFVGVK